jgi:hypothetical protein
VRGFGWMRKLIPDIRRSTGHRIDKAEPRHPMRGGLVRGSIAVMALLLFMGVSAVSAHPAPSLPSVVAETPVPSGTPSGDASGSSPGGPQVATLGTQWTPQVAGNAVSTGPLPTATVRAQDTSSSVSSINYIQVFSPFAWGRTSIGGLSVTMELKDQTDTLIGVPCQTFRSSPTPSSIVIDNYQLYYETVFVNPNASPTPDPRSCTPQVNIKPGDKVHVVTSGIDPSTGQFLTQDKTILVDDIDAWASYQNNTVSGKAPPGSTVDVEATGLSLGGNSYIPPAGNTCGQVTADGTTGSFTVSSFYTGSSTCGTPNLMQGSAGFVRVIHNTGDEVFTVWGNNVLALENSTRVHGYAFGIPNSPGGLQPNVAVPHPPPVVSFTYTPKGGSPVVTIVPTSSLRPYILDMSSTISGGDTFDVQINEGHVNHIQVQPMTASIDLGGGQVTGTGPPNTPMVVAVGRVDGYLTGLSTWTFLQSNVSTNGAGSFATGPISCGTSKYLALQPGSFGYTGYEDARGNFLYLGFAAPTTYVMSDYPFVEGYVASGLVHPSITLKAPDGTVKDSQTLTPAILGFSGQSIGGTLYFNVYYNETPSQFILPGDTVYVSSGSQNLTIPVDRITAYVNPDAEFVSGQAPPGASVRVIPEGHRTAYVDLTADTSGHFTANNPYTNYTWQNCTLGTTTVGYNPGDGGRVYLQHPDGSQVFSYFGRFIVVNENEPYVEAYIYATHGIPFFTASTQTVTLVDTPPQGSPSTAASNGGGTGNGYVKFSTTTSPIPLTTKVRAGDSITVSFLEGPNGVTRPATITLNTVPLVTGSPDLDTSTLAGVAPSSWWGVATLSGPVSAGPVSIPPRQFSAYGPLQFKNGTTPVTLGQGYNGLVWFSDALGHKVWIAWAVTTLPVKIIGFLHPGDTRVCGKAPPNSTVTIYDVTDSSTGLSIILGTGTSDGSGNFCVTVSPLHLYQVVMAGSGGILSQPVVVLPSIYLPIVFR